MIAIKGIEMPKCCKECMLNNVDSPWFGLCRTTGNNVIEYKDSRHPNCPLTEIVTCKDCKYCYQITDAPNVWFCERHNCVSKNFYCADAERKE